MRTRAQWQVAASIAGAVGLIAGCAVDDTAVAPAVRAGGLLAAAEGTGFEFAAVSASAVCSNGGDALQPFVLPAGFRQLAVATEPSFADVPDMNALNESGPRPGRYLYASHEVGSNGSLSVTDLETGVTTTVAQRADWESLDGVTWTPWGTVLFAEETNAARFRDPAVPQAVAGLVYEAFLNAADPTKADSVVARPAIGSKSHEGMRFDVQGNLYSISERTPGYVFKFVPDRKGDLSSGQTYVLKVTAPSGDRVGEAAWVPLDREAVEVDASAAADAIGATGYGRPEDVELATSTGNNRGGANVLYVAITSEHRVLAVELRAPAGAKTHETARIVNYVAVGTNATSEFTMPDNLALDRQGNLFITEDPGGNTASGKRGDDIWVARPAQGSASAASRVERFATLTDCEAEPTGVYVDKAHDRLFVNVQHRGGDRLDKTMVIWKE